MAIGKQFTFKVRETSATALALDGVTFKEFSHEAGAQTTTSVTKEDFAATEFDAFVVKVSYPAGSIPANSTTLSAMLTTCSQAIRAKYGAPEAVSL